MDAVITDSLRVLSGCELGDPKKFFESIIEILAELFQADDAGNVDQFIVKLADRAGSDGFADAGETFSRYLEDNYGADVLRALAEEQPDAITAEYERVLAEASAITDDSYDEAAWNEFLTEYGLQWNGDRDTWDEFRDWFIYYARERGLGSPAARFLDYAETAADPVAVFAEYGVPVAGAQQPADTQEDAATWQSFRAEYGSAWNGDENAWAAFVDYFLYYADEHGVPDAARAFIDDAPEDNEARIQYFGLSDEVLAAHGQFAEVAQDADHVPPELEDPLSKAFAELIKEIPEAAELTAEQMQQLIKMPEVTEAIEDVSSEDQPSELGEPP